MQTQVCKVFPDFMGEFFPGTTPGKADRGNILSKDYSVIVGNWQFFSEPGVYKINFFEDEEILYNFLHRMNEQQSMGWSPEAIAEFATQKIPGKFRPLLFEKFRSNDVKILSRCGDSVLIALSLAVSTDY